MLRCSGWSGVLPYATWLPILLGFLSAIGPISTDMYLPAFPAIELSLGLKLGSVQVTLATWFFGLAVGQITQGSLADRFGRRGPLIVGTVLYTLANAGCAMAQDLPTLSVLRFLAAVGGSASMVIPRAIVRDLTEGQAAARLMSRLILVMGAAPILAPSLGSLFLGFASWRSIFWFCTAYGAISCALVVGLLPDTLPKAKRIRLGPGAMAARYWQILCDRSFVCHALMGGAGMFGMFAFISGAPGALIEGYQFSTTQFGIAFGSCAGCFIVCSQINPRVLPYLGADRVLRLAVRCFCAAGLGLFLMSVVPPLFGLRAVWWLQLPFVAMAMGCQGFNMPNSAVGAMARHAAHAGTASALMGMIQFCLAANSGLLAGLFSDGSFRPVGVLMLVGGTGAVVADIFRRRIAGVRPGLDMMPRA